MELADLCELPGNARVQFRFPNATVEVLADASSILIRRPDGVTTVNSGGINWPYGCPPIDYSSLALEDIQAIAKVAKAFRAAEGTLPEEEE